MNKFGFVIALIIGVGAMLVIPSPIGHVAKASTCSFSIGGVFSGSSTTSGSCSAGGASSSGGPFADASGGGSKSSCTSTSANQGSSGLTVQNSNGAVSCSAHSP